MSILLDAGTRVLVHGASSAVGSYQLGRMRKYGTNVVGVVSRGESDVDLPVFADLDDAQAACDADLLVSYANGRYLAATAEAAFAAGIKTVVPVAEEVRFRDIVAARRAARKVGGALVGPNTNGILTPGEAVVGMFAPEFGEPGRVGVISRSGTLGYGALLEMKRAGIGQSTVVGIGGALGRGLGAAEAMRMFDADPETDVVVFLGETGSNEEEDLAAEIEKGDIATPAVALIVGAVGRPDQVMGHAGAVVYGSKGGYAEKISALSAAGVFVAEHLGALADAIRSVLPTASSVGRETA